MEELGFVNVVLRLRDLQFVDRGWIERDRDQTIAQRYERNRAVRVGCVHVGFGHLFVVCVPRIRPFWSVPRIRLGVWIRHRR